MFYKVTLEAKTSYYFDKDYGTTKEQALDLAEEWFTHYIPNITIEEVEEEGD